MNACSSVRRRHAPKHPEELHTACNQILIRSRIEATPSNARDMWSRVRLAVVETRATVPAQWMRDLLVMEVCVASLPRSYESASKTAPSAFVLQA